MAFITAPELKERVAAMLKVEGVDVKDYYDVLIADSVEAAYQDIRAALSDRGLTPAQTATWARGREFNFDIGLYWVFVKAAGLHDYSDKYIPRLDRRLELATVTLLDGDGNPIEPEEAAPVSHGIIKRHPLDRFTENDYQRGGAGSFKRT